MAQHYSLSRRKEPKLYRFMYKIVQYCVRPHNLRKFKIMREQRSYFDRIETVHRKTVMLLPDNYNPGGLAFVVKPVTLEDKEWDQRKYGGSDFRNKACVEVHTDLRGKITQIYLPL